MAREAEEERLHLVVGTVLAGDPVARTPLAGCGRVRHAPVRCGRGAIRDQSL